MEISRIESVRSFESDDAAGLATLEEIWVAAPETDEGRAFLVWLMPFRGRKAAEELIQQLGALREGTIVPPPPLLTGINAGRDTYVPVAMRRSLIAARTSGDRFELEMRTYRQHRRARKTVLVPSRIALDKLSASSTVFCVEPLLPISSTLPVEGREPDRPLPGNMSTLPIVSIVDGGLMVASYLNAEAWRAPPLA